MVVQCGLSSGYPSQHAVIDSERTERCMAAGSIIENTHGQCCGTDSVTTLIEYENDSTLELKLCYSGYNAIIQYDLVNDSNSAMSSPCLCSPLVSDNHLSFLTKRIYLEDKTGTRITNHDVRNRTTHPPSIQRVRPGRAHRKLVRL